MADQHRVLPTEYFEGEWHIPTADGPEPLAVVVFVETPSPETGHVGWCWWALGKMGEAATYDDACSCAVHALEMKTAERAES